MFIREGLLNPLSTALINVMAADSETSAEMKSKIIQILLVFCQVSMSDVHVRNALGTRMVVRSKSQLIYKPSVLALTYHVFKD